MAGSLDLGTLFGKIAMDMSGLTAAELEARKFANNTRSHFESIEKAGKAMTSVVTTSVVAAGVASVKLSQDLNKAVREVNSLLDASDKDFNGLKNQIRDVSLALGTDVVESANAAYEALGAGVPKDNLIDFMRVAGKAAIGGVTEMKVVVDGLTTVTNAWAGSAGDAQTIADQMFIAVKYGKVTFDELARSINNVSALAPELGVSFREVAAASAVMTAQGVPQSKAMTQMQQAMVALVTPNETMVKLLKAAGIESVKTTIKQKGLAGTYDILRKASDKNRISIEKSVGSSEALGFVLKTTGMNAEKFAVAMKQVENSGGSLDAAFKELDQARGFDKLLNNLKTFGTIIGDIILPVLNPVIEQSNAWLMQVNQLDPGLVRLGVTLGAVAAALGPVLLVVGKLGALIAPMILQTGGLSTALGSLAAMGGPVVLAIAAIVGAGYLLYKHWDEVKKFVSDLVTSVVSWFQKWVSDNAGLIEEIKAAWDGFVSSASALWQTLWGIISKFVEDSITKLNELLAPIGGIQGAWELLKVGIGEALTQIGVWLKEFLESVTSIFNDIDNAIKTGDWSFLKDLIRETTKQIVIILKELPGEFAKIFNEIFDYLKSLDWKTIGKNMMEGLKDGILATGQGVIDAVNGVADSVIEGAKEAFDTHSPSRVFADIGKNLMTGLSLGVSDNVQGAVSAVIMASDQIISTAKEKLSAEEIHKRLVENVSGKVLELNKSITLEGDENNFELQLAKEQAYYDRSLALLKQAEELKIASIRPYHDLRAQMEEQHAQRMTDIYKTIVSSTRQSLDATLQSLEQFGGKQSGIYKAIFAVSKAFAIAEATLAMSQNIANASKVGFPYNIPFIAGAFAQGASILASVNSVAGAFNNGGHIPTGQIGVVGEKRGELVSGPANVFSAQNTHELFSGMGGGSSSGNFFVEINNYGGAKVETQESDTPNGKLLRIMIDATKKEIATEVLRGDGVVDRAFAQVYGMQRTGT